MTAPGAGGGDEALVRAAPPAPLVLSLGESLIDLIVADGAPDLATASTFVARPGGAPANAAVALARLGVRCGFVGVVGDDPFGARLRAALAGEGVETAHLRTTTAAATTLAFTWKDAAGDGHFWLLRSADRELAPADVDAAGIGEAAAVVAGSVALAGQPSRAAVTHAAEVAAAAGVPICFDVNLRPTLWPDLGAAREACAPILARATLVKLSVADARGLLGGDNAPAAIIERFRNRGASVVVLTDGERGCWYAAGTGGAVRHVPAFRVEAVEPTGAGDAFLAALLARLLARDWSPPTDGDLRYAAAAGALATTRPGAWEGLPSAAELDAFLARS